MGVEPSFVCLCVSVCLLRFSIINISRNNWPITINFYLKLYWDGRKAALGFGLDRIRTLVSMLTDRSHKVIMGIYCDHSSTFIFAWIFFILAGNKDNHKITDRFEIRPNPTTDCGVSCP